MVAARKSVENHAEEIKIYYDGNETSDRCGITFCSWRLTIITFETDLNNSV